VQVCDYDLSFNTMSIERVNLRDLVFTSAIIQHPNNNLRNVIVAENKRSFITNKRHRGGSVDGCVFGGGCLCGGGGDGCGGGRMGGCVFPLAAIGLSGSKQFVSMILWSLISYICMVQ